MSSVILLSLLKAFIRFYANASYPVTLTILCSAKFEPVVLKLLKCCFISELLHEFIQAA